MRPIKLEIQGLTAYREKAEIDFSNLDLFAITGHTGAGKTTIVDAITYALFGQAPRVSDDIKQLISQGEDRMRVNLEFSSDGRRYRIHRSTGRRGASTVQLERLDEDSGEWIGESDRAREATHRVAQILGMDYEGFVRSVLLPQGQFQQFLAGKPEERRKVLDGLLRLDVFGGMLQRANQIAAENEATAKNIESVLDTQYADATMEALKEAESELKRLKSFADGLLSAQESVSGALSIAEKVAHAIEQEGTAKEELKEIEKRLADAEETLKGGAEKVTALKSELGEIERKIGENGFDEKVYDQAKEALPIAREVEDREKSLAGYEKKLADATKRLDDARSAEASSAKAAGDAKSALDKANAALEETFHENAAVRLRQSITKGDPCPVCGQTVGELPKGKQPSVDEARRVRDEAASAAERADAHRQEAAKEVGLANQALKILEEQQTRDARDLDSKRADLLKLTGAGLASSTAIEATVKGQIKLRDERSQLEEQAAATRKKHEVSSTALAEAKTTLTVAKTEAASAKKQIADAQGVISDGRKSLSELAVQNDWSDVSESLSEELDVVPLLRRRDKEIDDALGEANKGIGATEKSIETIAEGIERAKELRAEQKEARAAATLAKDLASLLGVRAFPNYIRERALKVLAQDGSAQLLKISDNRYEFRVEGQEFMVADGWNLGEARSVKTLSGGETFLASLALALALAERLPTLGAGTHASALESLLIDEGFSNLDVETLDEVAKALEIIAEDRTRMVGIVTHLEELAERMPARIRVHKDRSHSTVTIE